MSRQPVPIEVVRESEPADEPALLAGPQTIRSLALTGTFVLLIAYTAYFAAPILIPFSLAFLLSLLLAPAVRALQKIWVPPGVAAAIVVVSLVAVVGVPSWLLSEPAAEWVSDMPRDLRGVSAKLRALTAPIQDMHDAAMQVEKLTTIDDGNTTPVVKVEEPGATEVFLNGTPRFLSSLAIVLVLLYLLLASGDSLLRKLVSLAPDAERKRRIVGVTRRIQEDLFQYLATMTLINIGVGVAVAIAMRILEVPNPLLWGVLAGVLNYAPYLGPALTVALLALAGLMTFDTLAQSLAVPFVYVGITVLEGQILTPLIVGQRLALSPVVIFISIVVMGWLWGTAGALIAVPLLASFRIACESLPPMRGAAELLGR